MLLGHIEEGEGALRGGQEEEVTGVLELGEGSEGGGEVGSVEVL